MRLMMVNGVYGAPEHLAALGEALAPEIETAVFAFKRDGLPDPSARTGFSPMVERLDRALEVFAPREGGERPALLGFSLGGALVLEYALARPRSLAGILLVNAYGRYIKGPIEAGVMPAIWSWPPAWTHPGLLANVVHRVPWLRRGLFHPGTPPEAIERGVRAASTVTTHDDLRFQLAYLHLPAPKGFDWRLRELSEQVPVLLVSSRDDIIVSPRHTDELEACMPGAKRLPPFEGGHAFFQHEPERLAKAVREFLGGLR